MLPCSMTPSLPPTLPDHEWRLPYESRLDSRPATQIDLVVIHCTELPDMKMAREYGERVHYDAGTGNSGHFYIDRDGTVHVFVSPLKIANHTRGYNPRSIGIEIVNTGRYPHWFDSRHQAMTEAYTSAQIHALEGLLTRLKTDLPNLRFIAGHEDLDTAKVSATDDPALQVWRKRDPGPKFPWDAVIAATGLERLKP